MSLNSVLLNQSKEAKGLKNHNEVQTGGTRQIAVAGKAPMRFIGYVETGIHAQKAYKGQAKPPAMEVSMTFEVFGTKNTTEVKDEKTGKVTKKGALLKIDMTIKQNEKAKFKKLFDKMKAGRGDNITHMSHMLNEVFMGTIRHQKSKTSDNVYPTLQAEDESWMIGAPIIEIIDEEGNVTGEKDVTKATPPASFPLRLFLQDAPSIEQWQSIKVEGTYTKKLKDKDGKEIGEEEVSKNFLQEKIQAALNWDGSPMQLLLLDLGDAGEVEGDDGEDFVPPDEAPELETEEEVVEEAPAPKSAVKNSATTAAKSSASQPTAAKGKKQSATTATKSPSKPKAEEPASEDDADDLAAIGL